MDSDYRVSHSLTCEHLMKHESLSCPVSVRHLTFKKCMYQVFLYTGLSKKMDGNWNRYNLKGTGRIYTFRVLKYSEKFKVLNLP